MKIKPAPGFILVELLEENETETGIYVPSDTDSPMTAKVLQAGGSVIRESTYINAPTQEGDTVYFIKNSHREIPSKGQKQKIAFIAFEHILGVVEK